MKFHKDGTLPQDGEIFVFGSNLAGHHAGGAARCAAAQFGAEAGVAVGLTGKSYAIPTVSASIEPLELEDIAAYTSEFLAVATASERHFFVTRIGCGIAGFSDDQIAPMFLGAPDNCSFPEEWAQYLERKVIAYKAFNKDLKCRDFQYEIGKTYAHSGEVNACEAGFHACENPLDVLNYYDLCDSRFALVELSGELSRHGDDSKIASAKINIKAELSLPKFVDSAIEWVKQVCNIEKPDFSKASGHYSKLAASGDYSKLSASGKSSQLAASGDSSQLAASGDSSQLAASGDYSKLSASGDYSKLSASGDYSQLAASGDYSQLAASGKSSIAIASSVGSIAKAGELGCIALTRWVDSEKRYRMSVGYVGENGIKSDTFYELDNNGNFVEVV